VSALLLGGSPGSGAATDSQHGSRFRSDTDLCSPKHAIHCLLHHRLWPRPDCHWYHRHRYNCRQPTRSAITPPPRSPCTPAAKRAFAATARPALAKGTSNSAIVSHRLLPSATRQVGAIAAPTAARSLAATARARSALAGGTSASAIAARSAFAGSTSNSAIVSHRPSTKRPLCALTARQLATAAARQLTARQLTLVAAQQLALAAAQQLALAAAQQLALAAAQQLALAAAQQLALAAAQQHALATATVRCSRRQLGQLIVASSWTVRVHSTIRPHVGYVAGQSVLSNVATDTFSTHDTKAACRRPVLFAQLCLGFSTMVHTTLPRHMGPQGSSCQFRTESTHQRGPIADITRTR
jgi:hypothetical protein